MSEVLLAEILGVPCTTIYDYEDNGVTRVSIDLIKRIAKVLETSPEYLEGKSPIRKRAVGLQRQDRVQFVEYKSNREARIILLLQTFKKLDENNQTKVLDYAAKLCDIQEMEDNL